MELKKRVRRVHLSQDIRQCKRARWRTDMDPFAYGIFVPSPPNDVRRRSSDGRGWRALEGTGVQRKPKIQVEKPWSLIFRAERRSCFCVSSPGIVIHHRTHQERHSHLNQVFSTPQMRGTVRKAMVECRNNGRGPRHQVTHALTFATPTCQLPLTIAFCLSRQSQHKHLLIRMSSYNKINKNTVHNAGHPGQATHKATDKARKMVVVGGRLGAGLASGGRILPRDALLRGGDAQNAQGTGAIDEQGASRPTSATSTVTLFGDESVERILKEALHTGKYQQKPTPKQRRPAAKTTRIPDNQRFRYCKYTKAPKASDVPPLEEMIMAHVTDKNVTASRQAELVADNAVKDFAFLANKARQGRGQQSGEDKEGLSSLQSLLRELQKGPVNQDQLKARSQRRMGVSPSQSVRAQMPMGVANKRALVPFKFPSPRNHTDEPANAVGFMEQAALDASPSPLELPASYYEYEADEAYKTRVNKDAYMRAPSPSELPAPTDHVAEDARRAFEAMMPPRSYDLPRCPRARQRFVLYSTLQALPGSPE
ncbi:hypothetical protein EV121DRAFT_275528 [Schizophyllum commune]